MGAAIASEDRRFGRASELLLLGDKVTATARDRSGRERGRALTGICSSGGAIARRLADGPAFAFGTTKSLQFPFGKRQRKR